MGSTALGHGGVMVLYIYSTLGICGAIIQSIYIKNNYFNKGKIAILDISSITLLLTIGLFSLLITLLGYTQAMSEILAFAVLVVIPCFAFAALSYYVTTKNNKG